MKRLAQNAMDSLAGYYTRAGIIAFSLAVLAGPAYTVDAYDALGNLISELAAQNTRNNFIMVAGFLALGIGIVADGVRSFQRPALPFIAFGLFMALAGLFGHKPLAADIPYSAFAHTAHSVLATLAGVSISLALLWHARRCAVRSRRFVALALAALCLVLPLTMLAFPAYQGLIQRVMYLLVFWWLWRYFPTLDAAAPTIEPACTGKPV